MLEHWLTSGPFRAKGIRFTMKMLDEFPRDWGLSTDFTLQCRQSLPWSQESKTCSHSAAGHCFFQYLLKRLFDSMSLSPLISPPLMLWLCSYKAVRRLVNKTQNIPVQADLLHRDTTPVFRAEGLEGSLAKSPKLSQCGLGVTAEGQGGSVA